MSAPSEGWSRRRLRSERGLLAAIAQADTGGLDALSMRQLAEMREVSPAVLARHVSDKDDRIATMVDAVLTEMELPPIGGDLR